MALIQLSLATRTILVCRHMHSLQLLQLVAIKARLDARTEFEILERSLKGGWKHHICDILAL